MNARKNARTQARTCDRQSSSVPLRVGVVSPPKGTFLCEPRSPNCDSKPVKKSYSWSLTTVLTYVFFALHAACARFCVRRLRLQQNRVRDRAHQLRRGQHGRSLGGLMGVGGRGRACTWEVAQRSFEAQHHSRGKCCTACLLVCMLARE